MLPTLVVLPSMWAVLSTWEREQADRLMSRVVLAAEVVPAVSEKEYRACDISLVVPVVSALSSTMMTPYNDWEQLRAYLLSQFWTDASSCSCPSFPSPESVQEVFPSGSTTHGPIASAQALPRLEQCVFSSTAYSCFSSS